MHYILVNGANLDILHLQGRSAGILPAYRVQTG